MRKKQKTRTRKTKQQIETERTIVIDAHYKMDIVKTTRESDGLLHPLNILDEHLNKQYADGWKFVDRILLGNDNTKSANSPVIGLLFEKIELDWSRVELIDNVSSGKTQFQLEE